MQREAHPDKFAAQGVAAQRVAMQWSVRINEAYQRLKEFLENYRYRLDEGEAADDQKDVEEWWHARFGGTGVWGAVTMRGGESR